MISCLLAHWRLQFNSLALGTISAKLRSTMTSAPHLPLCTVVVGSYNNLAGRKALHPTSVAFTSQADLPAASPRIDSLSPHEGARWMIRLGSSTRDLGWRLAAVLAAVSWMSPNLSAEDKPAASSGDKPAAEKPRRSVTTPTSCRSSRPTARVATSRPRRAASST